MKKVIVSSILLSGVISTWLYASYTAGDPPSADIGTDPDVTYYGVGMTLDLSVENFEDKDCTDADPPEEEDDALDTIEFSVDKGTLTNPTSETQAKLTMPTSKGSVEIELKVNDKGDKADDGGLTDVASKTITVGKPKTATFQGPPTQITNPVEGGEYIYLVKDEDDKAFKAPGAEVDETLAATMLFNADGEPITLTVPSQNKTNVQFGEIDGNGNFADPVGLSLATLTNLAQASGAQSTFSAFFHISSHTYRVKSGVWTSVNGNFPKGVHFQMSKNQDKWEVDSVGLQPQQ